jgi:hypothetical protein
MKIASYLVKKSDQYNWTISTERVIEDGDHKGETVTKVLEYHSTLTTLAASLLELVVADEDVETVNDLILALDIARTGIITEIQKMGV